MKQNIYLYLNFRAIEQEKIYMIFAVSLLTHFWRKVSRILILTKPGKNQIRRTGRRFKPHFSP